ncbi:MAG: hydrolase [Planctomycetota bacterium]|jgi:nicotinamidase-related amidase
MIPFLEKDHAGLVVIDLQERFRDLVDGLPAVVAACSRLVRFCARLDVPMVVTEHYPAGLGRTLPELAETLPASATRLEKITFSCCGDDGFMQAVRDLGRAQWILCGIEAHVCVYQTAIGLLREGRQVAVAADAVSSRRGADREVGIERMRDLGVQVMSVEMILFEILKQAKTDDFQAVADLLKE